jgi:hypothetical protein
LPDQEINHLSLCSSLKALRITNCNLLGDGMPFFDMLSDIGLLPSLEEVGIQHLRNATHGSILEAGQVSVKRHRPSLRLYVGNVCEGHLKHAFRFNPGSREGISRKPFPWFAFLMLIIHSTLLTLTYTQTSQKANRMKFRRNIFQQMMMNRVEIIH